MQEDLPKDRHAPLIATQTASSLVLWVLVGLAVVSLVFTTREIPNPGQADVAFSPAPSDTAL